MTEFQLVDPQFVADHLSNAHADPPCLLLEAHFTSLDHPALPDSSPSRHIPGAIQVHPSYLEAGTDQSKYYPHYQCPADGNLLPDADLILALRRLGLTPDTLVIVYGSEPDGTMAAARLVWALLYAGGHQVRLLDGGLDSWLASARPTSSQCAHAWQLGQNDDCLAPNSTSPWITRPDYLATTAEAREVSRNSQSTASRLVDVRKEGEWDGSLTHYYPFFSKAGHIPNAKLQGDWNNLLDMTTHKLATTLAAVEQRWREQGIIDDGVEARNTTLIFYCGTGWRSSISFLVALLLGLKAKNYDGGFYRWSWNEENKIALGDDAPLPVSE